MKEYPSRPGTDQPKKMQPHNWKYGTDPRTHYMQRTWITRKAQADHRKESWDFPFREWYDMWDDKFDLIGRKGDDYGMGRIDPTKPWCKENCYIDLRKKILANAKALDRRYEIHTPKGIFASTQKAADAYNVTVHFIIKWIDDPEMEFSKPFFKSKKK